MLRMRNSPNRNRSKFEIIAEILMDLRAPTCKTSIMSHCNMNTTQSGQYLNLMTSRGLVQIDETARNVTYQRTEAGREFLKSFNKIILLLDPSISPAHLIACMY